MVKILEKYFKTIYRLKIHVELKGMAYTQNTFSSQFHSREHMHIVWFSSDLNMSLKDVFKTIIGIN